MHVILNDLACNRFFHHVNWGHITLIDFEWGRYGSLDHN